MNKKRTSDCIAQMVWNAAANAYVDEGMRLWKLFGHDAVQSKGVIKDKDEL